MHSCSPGSRNRAVLLEIVGTTLTVLSVGWLSLSRTVAVGSASLTTAPVTVMIGGGSSSRIVKVAVPRSIVASTGSDSAIVNAWLGSSTVSSLRTTDALTVVVLAGNV